MSMLLDPKYTVNQKRILSIIHANRSSTRQSLVAATGLSALTIAKIIAGFLSDGILIEEGKLSSTGGRKASTLCLRPDLSYVISVDIGASATRFGVVNIGGQVIYKEEINYFEGVFPVNALSLEQLRDHLLRIYEKHRDLEIIGIHLCISGLVDSKTHQVVFCPNIHGYDGVDVIACLAPHFDVPIFLDTSARTMTLAVRHYGIAQLVENLVYISVGYSVSAGIVINGNLLEGSCGFAGEVGHIFVSNEIDTICTCGNTGCLELHVTLTAILERIRNALSVPGVYSLLKGSGADMQHLTIDDVQRALHDGDKLVYSVITRVGEELGKMVADITNALNPEMVVLGGGTIQTLDILVPEVERTVRQKAMITNLRNLLVEKDDLGFDCALMGGAVQVLNRLLHTGV